MAIGYGLERRGAVYYWRKRLPEFIAQRIGANQLRYSLKTKDLAAARYLAASLNAKAAELMLDELPDVTKSQLSAVFLATLKDHKRKLAILTDLSRDDPTFDAEAEALAETAKGWSYKLFSKHGAGVTMSTKVQAELSEAGLEAATVKAVGIALHEMKESGQNRPSRFRIAERMRTAGIVMSAATVAKVEPVYLRALGEALLDTKPRYEDERIDYDTLCAKAVDGMARTQGPGNNTFNCEEQPKAEFGREQNVYSDLAHHEFGPASDHSKVVNHDTDRSQCASPGASRKAPIHRTVPENGVKSSKVVVPGKTPAGVAGDIERIGAKLISAKVEDEEWDEKTVRQARMIFNLLSRFLSEERSIASLTDLSQADLDAFDGFLRILFKSYGKSPADKVRSIAELRVIGANKPASERGLSGQTRNRHLTFIGQLLRRAKSSGLKLDPELELAEFRSKKSGRGRDDRPIPKPEQIETFFRSPIFTGCRDWNDMHREGPLTFHRGAYFGPLLGNYQGMRREEYCGLSVADVVSDLGDNPFLVVEKNAFRRVKNHQSKRSLALHPELIRLGFLEYVAMIRGLGYERLFPDLYSPTTKSPLGDRLYDEIIWPAPTGWSGVNLSAMSASAPRLAWPATPVR